MGKLCKTKVTLCKEVLKETMTKRERKYRDSIKKCLGRQRQKRERLLHQRNQSQSPIFDMKLTNKVLTAKYLTDNLFL